MLEIWSRLYFQQIKNIIKPFWIERVGIVRMKMKARGIEQIFLKAWPCYLQNSLKIYKSLENFNNSNLLTRIKCDCAEKTVSLCWYVRKQNSLQNETTRILVRQKLIIFEVLNFCKVERPYSIKICSTLKTMTNKGGPPFFLHHHKNCCRKSSNIR